MEGENTTEFNSNLASLSRIDEIRKNIIKTKLTDEYMLRFRLLDALETECFYKMDKHKKEGDNCNRCKSQDYYNRLSKIASLVERNNDKNLIGNFERLMRDYEMFLMDFMGAKGMLLKDGYNNQGL